MNQEHQQNIYHANVNISLRVKSVGRIKSGIFTSVGVSVKIQKNIVFAKRIIFGVLLHVVDKMVKMQEVDDSVY